MGKKSSKVDSFFQFVSFQSLIFFAHDLYFCLVLILQFSFSLTFWVDFSCQISTFKQ